MAKNLSIIRFSSFDNRLSHFNKVLGSYLFPPMLINYIKVSKSKRKKYEL
jgi:hypothetical protein